MTAPTVRSPAPLHRRAARRIAAAVATALLVPIRAPEAAAAETAPAVMIVFDGSGSMWGRIDGDRLSRLQAARDALRRALPALSADTRVGLASFGHRRKGDCSDVETLVAPAARDVEALMGALDRLNPRGKGPLALAVREAAKVLGDLGGGSATVILIHDGPDNCQQDACAAAAEIAKAQPGLVIHTVGLGLEAEDARKMACVAAATGGRTYDARDGAAIDEAVAAALKLVHPMPGRTARPAPAPTPAARPERPAAAPAGAVSSREPAAPPGLDLAAVLTADGPPIDAPVHWRVLKADGNGPPLLEADAPRLVRALAPATYTVEARLGLATARQRITVTDKPASPVRVPLDAGVVTPAARAHKDGGIVEGATYSIREVKPGAGTTGKGAGVGRTLWIGRSGGSDIVLPTGTYIVRAETGGVVRDETVALAAGARKTLDMVMGTGQLVLGAALSDDGPALDAVTFIVTEDDPDSPRGLREVARSAAARPELVLPAGTYYVTARTASAEARQRIAVGAGDVVKRTIPLGVSRLSVATHLDVPQGARRPPILTRVVRADGDRGEAARSAVADPAFLLPAGRYRVLSQAGQQNVRAERSIEIKPREDARLAVDFNAAHVALKVRDGASTALDQYWEVRDAAGEVVWRTTQSEVRMTLAPGRYTASVEWRGRRLETSFDVARGDHRTVLVGAE